MALTIEQLAKEAMQLSAATRAQLAEQLFESVIDADDDELNKLWAAEITQRCDEIRDGTAKLVPGELVMAEVRRVVGR